MGLLPSRCPGPGTTLSVLAPMICCLPPFLPFSWPCLFSWERLSDLGQTRSFCTKPCHGPQKLRSPQVCRICPHRPSDSLSSSLLRPCWVHSLCRLLAIRVLPRGPPWACHPLPLTCHSPARHGITYLIDCSLVSEYKPQEGRASDSLTSVSPALGRAWVPAHEWVDTSFLPYLQVFAPAVPSAWRALLPFPR